MNWKNPVSVSSSKRVWIGSINQSIFISGLYTHMLIDMLLFDYSEQSSKPWFISFITWKISSVCPHPWPSTLIHSFSFIYHMQLFHQSMKKSYICQYFGAPCPHKKGRANFITDHWFTVFVASEHKKYFFNAFVAKMSLLLFKYVVCCNLILPIQKGMSK